MRFRKKKVLVTDDNQGHITRISSLLNKMGFSTVPAESGHEAIKLSKIMSPDLILLDMNMPEMSGLEALKLLREDPRIAEVPVVMISSTLTIETAELCMSMGCFDHLIKPIDIDKLNVILQKHLFKPHGQRRENLRVYFSGKVELTHSGHTEELYCKTLSEGGMYLKRKEPLPVGSEVHARIFLDDKSHLDFDGAVIYNNPHQGVDMPQGMAIEFVAPRSEQIKALSDFIHKLLSE